MVVSISLISGYVVELISLSVVMCRLYIYIYIYISLYIYIYIYIYIYKRYISIFIQLHICFSRILYCLFFFFQDKLYWC